MNAPGQQRTGWYDGSWASGADRAVREWATTDRRKSPIFDDDEVIGFGLQTRDNGRKPFILAFDPI
jgi:hypothetical protein